MEPSPLPINLVVRPDSLALQSASDDPRPWPSAASWTNVYSPPERPGVWVGHLVQWHKDPEPHRSAWYCFDDINPRSTHPFTALRALENDPLGDTLLGRHGHDVGWHYLLGVERDRLRPGLVRQVGELAFRKR